MKNIEGFNLNSRLWSIHVTLQIGMYELRERV